jgi:hypothetical protein
MTTQEIQIRIQSLKTIIDLIDGKEFNGMKLTEPGACEYVIDGKPNESCIVGCAMKPEVRKKIVSVRKGGYNGETVENLFREQVLIEGDMLLQGITQQEWRKLQLIFDKQVLIEGDMLLQGITQQEWRKLQLIFDNNDNNDNGGYRKPLPNDEAVLAKMRDFCLMRLEELE